MRRPPPDLIYTLLDKTSSPRFPLRVLPVFRLPALSLFPGQSPAHEVDAWVPEHYCSLSSWIFRKPWGDGEKIIIIELVQRNVCDRYGVKLSELTAKNRTKAVVFPCQVAMYLSRHLSPMPPSPRSAARWAAEITRVCSMPSRRSKR